MKYKKGHFYIENVSAEKIAKSFGTPSYVYSYEKIKNNINNFKKNFKTINPLICFSVKSNSNLKILNLICKLGLGAEMWSSVSAVMNRYLMEVDAPMWSKRISDFVLRGSGLSHITQSGKWAYGMSVMGTLADESGKEVSRDVDIDESKYTKLLPEFVCKHPDHDPTQSTGSRVHTAVSVKVPALQLVSPVKLYPDSHSSVHDSSCSNVSSHLSSPVPKLPLAGADIPVHG